jgi:hypothetical protein
VISCSISLNICIGMVWGSCMLRGMFSLKSSCCCVPVVLGEFFGYSTMMFKYDGKKCYG